MTYLVLKIFAYLAIALVSGGVAGWLLRNITAQRQEDDLQRTLTDSRSRVPHLESLARAADERAVKAKRRYAEKQSELESMTEQVKTFEQTVRERDRSIKSLESRNRALQAGGGDELIGNEDAAVISPINTATEPVDAAEPIEAADAQKNVACDRDHAADDALIAELNAELANLRDQLRQAKDELQAAELHLSDALSNRSGNDENDEIEELKARLRQKAEEHDLLQNTIKREKRKVVELERERELQNKSLQVLHQQLEIERETIAASGN